MKMIKEVLLNMNMVNYLIRLVVKMKGNYLCRIMRMKTKVILKKPRQKVFLQ